jgi:signal transduction histidine kinase
VTGWFGFKLPDRVASRIALTIVLALLATQSVNLLLFLAFRPPPPQAFSGHWLTERVEEAVAAVFAEAPGARLQHIEELNRQPWLSFAWSPDAPDLSEYGAGPPFAALQSLLAEGLQGHVRRIELTTVAPRFPMGLFRKPRPMLVPDDGAESGFEPAAAAMAEQWVPGFFRIAIQGTDGSWLEIRTHGPGEGWVPLLSLALWLLLTGIAVAGLSLWAARALIRPMRRLADAAAQLGTNLSAPAVEAGGPMEMRVIGHTFNEMQASLRRFIEHRTQMLAAISHDLRTPLTRLRLRADFVVDAGQRRKMLEDIAEMELMLSDTLAFASGEANAEAYRWIDLAALIASLCDDMIDLGHDVSYRGPNRMAFSCQPLAMRRALANLIGNAVTHGGNARLRLHDRDRAIEILIEDDGPGIPADQLDQVFQPFYRLEESRNRRTGGSGLGLAVVRTIIRAHGGEVSLRNAERGGLVASVLLPAVAEDRDRRRSRSDRNPRAIFR